MRRCIHDRVFSETEALDIFGRYVYELSDLPWQLHFEAHASPGTRHGTWSCS